MNLQLNYVQSIVQNQNKQRIKAQQASVSFVRLNKENIMEQLAISLNKKKKLKHCLKIWMKGTKCKTQKYLNNTLIISTKRIALLQWNS